MNRVIPAQAEISPPGMAEAPIYPALPMKQNFLSLYCTPLSFFLGKIRGAALLWQTHLSILAGPAVGRDKSNGGCQHPTPKQLCPPPLFSFPPLGKTRGAPLLWETQLSLHYPFISPFNCFPNPHQSFKFQ